MADKNDKASDSAKSEDKLAVPTEVPKSEERTLSTTTPAESKATGTVMMGAADAWVTIAKAYNTKEGWMKSTKAMSVGKAGCLVQVTTRETLPNGNVHIAESLTFAPNVNVYVIADGLGRLE
jgi:hypothetical protein